MIPILRRYNFKPDYKYIRTEAPQFVSSSCCSSCLIVVEEGELQAPGTARNVAILALFLCPSDLCRLPERGRLHGRAALQRRLERVHHRPVGRAAAVLLEMRRRIVVRRGPPRTVCGS